jgi:uncharacterized protein YybS (DUF2232 family)
MHTPTRVKSLVEGGILSGVAVLLSLLSAYLPVFGVFIKLFWPVPIILIVVRHGLKLGVLSVAVSGILIAVLLHPLSAISMVVGFGLTGIVMGWCFKQQMNSIMTLIYGSAAALVSNISMYAMAFLFFNINPLTMNTEAIKSAMPMAIEFYQKMGMDQATIDMMSTSMDQALVLVSVIIPAMIILTGAVECYINFIAARAILRRVGHAVGEFPPLKYWDFPKYIILGWSLCLAAWLGGAHYFGTQALTYKFGFNGFVLFSIGLFLQGLANVSFYLGKYNVSRFLRIAIGFLIITNGLLSYIVVFAGTADLFYNFRQLERKG